MANQQIAVDFIANSQRYMEAKQANRELRTKHETKLDQLRRRLAKLEAKSISYGPSWIHELIEPIRAGFIARFPAYRFETFGPFGMGAHTSIHMSPVDSDPEGINAVASITFAPDDLDHGTIKLLDTSQHLGRYSPGTIGDLNGFNHPTAPLPETFEELCQMLERQIEREV